MYEIERVISTCNTCLHFLTISIPFFPKTNVLVKPMEQMHIKIDVLFIDEISR